MLEDLNEEKTKRFAQQLSEWRVEEAIGTDDLLSLTLPLLNQVLEVHDQDRTAPLNGVDALRISLGHLWFANADAQEAKSNLGAVRRIEKSARASKLEVTDRIRESDDAKDFYRFKSQLIAGRDEVEVRQAYYLDYVAWEENLGHHDALTDVYILGLIMGSLATQLDLTDPEELETFMSVRRNLPAHNPRIQPVVAQVIEKMTDLDRHKRPQDLRTVVKALTHYREQEVDDGPGDSPVLDLTSDKQKQRQAIQRHLRNKLFEISRRNRLLFFRNTRSTVNLTVGSVPHVIDHEAIRPEDLLTTGQSLCSTLNQNKPLPLSRWLKFEDYPFLSASIDKTRLQAQRDEKEYGFSQLRLVLAFFRWHNLKEAPEERISSPLILVPATIKKRKGVKDSFIIHTQPQEAEVNPVLRHHLQVLYDIRLPERIDAGSFQEIRDIHTSLTEQLDRTAKGVELALVETPRIQLIHRTAKRRLDEFRRRQRRTGRGVRDFRGLAYSYARSTFEPLGVQIFDRDIRLANAPSRDIIEDDIHPRIFERMSGTESVAPPTTENQREFYALDHGEGSGPYNWEIDLCAVTLANFNYRKMTLVRDYTELIETPDGSNTNFDTLFSDRARDLTDELVATDLAGDFAVLPSDPSQNEALHRAQSGQSYVIQGPPGTGKSQTITNLIADYVARGKGVLFVCEKRAALDVVFHRLNQVGLDEVSTLIHDSQEDKKSFIQELKAQYENWLTRPPNEECEEARAAVLKKIEDELRVLRKFSDEMNRKLDGSEENLRSLIERRITAGLGDIEVSVQQRARMPRWASFLDARPLLLEIRDALQAAGHRGVLAQTPVRLLKGTLAKDPDLVEKIEAAVPRINSALDSAQESESLIGDFTGSNELLWEDLIEAVDFSRRVAPLARGKKLHLLDADDLESQKLASLLSRLTELESASEESLSNASGWDSTLDETAALKAKQAAEKWEGRFFAFFSGDWRRAKGHVRREYHGTKRGVRECLALLHDSLVAAREVSEMTSEIETKFGLADLNEIRSELLLAWNDRSSLSSLERTLIDCSIGRRDADGDVISIAGSRGSIRRASEELSEILTSFESLSREALVQEVKALSGQIDLAYEIADLLAEVDSAHPSISGSLRVIDLSFEDFEVAVLDENIQRQLRKNREVSRFDSRRLGTAVASLSNSYESLRHWNSQFAIESCRQRFHESVTRASSPLAGTSQDEKNWCRSFNRGRKVLEREFEKTRAYKSIRELIDSESGRVLRDLKPVWLMSPLSIADTLPLHEDLFDVVIFDEASQIPLEDAVPTLYRSRQMIVVGDEMQLPPTAFFSSQDEGEEEDGLPELYLYDLNADSFLTRAAGTLPSNMLSWHYRSRHESLIAFCNRAFYGGRLQSIPSISGVRKSSPIKVGNSDTLADPLEILLDRPISFHRLENSPYENQRNIGEAKYIAGLVREILCGDADDSIGIVAFSQAQQQEIERAIDQLAASDDDFQAKLATEEDREEDGQFIGLFIKNLENVQGDERDIIILSVCYGPNSKGRMIMNFGPINQNGGEKRLNVIFSRAKKNMLVVSSIEPQQITNTYNEGANALRNYLFYAKAVSIGDRDGIQASLAEYGSGGRGQQKNNGGQAVADELAVALRAKGYFVERNYGQSDLRCHLAVRAADSASFEMAVMIDDEAHYQIDNMAARYVTRPGILGSFGWKVITVLAKDWYRDPKTVVERITVALDSQVSDPDVTRVDRKES